MALDASSLEFMWQLLQRGLIRGQKEEAVAWLNSQHETGTELPVPIEKLITVYRASGDAAVLWDLALALAKGYYFDGCYGTKLVSLLVANRKLSIESAFALLSFDGVVIDQLPQSIQHVADVVWLLKQDALRGSSPTQDSLLAEALDGVQWN
jgi:hypothetical protein